MARRTEALGVGRQLEGDHGSGAVAGVRSLWRLRYVGAFDESIAGVELPSTLQQLDFGGGFTQ